MFPIVIFLGLAGLVYAANRASNTPPSQTVVSGPYRPRIVQRTIHRLPGHVEAPQTPKRNNPTALELCIHLIRGGHRPGQWLVEKAMKEAIALKRFDLVHAIHNRLQGSTQKSSGQGDDYDSFRKSSDTRTGEEKPEGSDPDSDSENDEEQDVASSPLDGVDGEQWSDFIRALKTQTPDFRTKKHVGSFHHSIDRLTDLGLEIPSSEDDQIKALQEDMKDCRESGLKMIQQWCGDVVEIGGKEVPITESGMLGVIKSAGFDGAEKWLTNPDDRKKFRMTTDTFMRTNGIF